MKEKSASSSSNSGGSGTVEVYADYGCAFWVHRLLGEEAHTEYVRCEKLKASRQSHGSS